MVGRSKKRRGPKHGGAQSKLKVSSSDSQKKQKQNPCGFLDKMRAKLSGGHFRMINEKLYTCTGNDALSYFKDDPKLFDMYHTGYQAQMSQWPEQPVNKIIKWLKDRSTSLAVVDFGCGEFIEFSSNYSCSVLVLDGAINFLILLSGDAHLAKSVRNKVFSFDLVSNDPSVIACDMSNTCLESSAVDVAVFSLSLMGINYPSYLTEAHRVLKPGGWLLIAEVKSRLDPKTGGADPDRFIKAVLELGFKSEAKDYSNKMFVLLYFKKKDKSSSKMREIQWPELKPCLYKRR
ncbi:hypothetical protein SAY87_008631 [Trapa incisa]|uniref:Ribosomal RNA-processing protein 8 n=1 Tax=Trapa incisa TaxID=236973 RepID=A0AAN7JXZ6_9MYRT|nr:hypothetical protein SAY87_008631 [Trapa incisa]